VAVKTFLLELFCPDFPDQIAVLKVIGKYVFTLDPAFVKTENPQQTVE
jgi:hypothetical protein